MKLASCGCKSIQERVTAEDVVAATAAKLQSGRGASKGAQVTPRDDAHQLPGGGRRRGGRRRSAPRSQRVQSGPLVDARRARRPRARAAAGSRPSDRRATCRHAARRRDHDDRRRPPAAERAANARDHLGADLEAAGADRWPQRDAQIGGPRAELARPGRAPPRAARPRPCRASRRAPRDRARARVDDQRRDAVGDEHAQRHPGHVGDERVRLDRARSPRDRRPARTRATAAPWTWRTT